MLHLLNVIAAILLATQPVFASSRACPKNLKVFPTGNIHSIMTEFGEGKPNTAEINHCHLGEKKCSDLEDYCTSKFIKDTETNAVTEIRCPTHLTRIEQKWMDKNTVETTIKEDGKLKTIMRQSRTGNCQVLLSK